jgi:hypothetical protein
MSARTWLEHSNRRTWVCWLQHRALYLLDLCSCSTHSLSAVAIHQVQPHTRGLKLCAHHAHTWAQTVCTPRSHVGSNCVHTTLTRGLKLCAHHACTHARSIDRSLSKCKATSSRSTSERNIQSDASPQQQMAANWVVPTEVRPPQPPPAPLTDHRHRHHYTYCKQRATTRQFFPASWQDRMECSSARTVQKGKPRKGKVVPLGPSGSEPPTR